MSKDEEKYDLSVEKSNEEPGKEDEEELLIPDSHRCGYGPWKPDCCQTWCNIPQILLSVLSFLAFAQTFVINGIVNVNISTIERRYSLSSGEVAWIPATYDITAGLVAIISGYLGVFMHHGSLLTWAACFLGLGSFTMTIPHWVGDTYEAGQATSKLCEIDGNGTDCSGDDGSMYLGCFILAQVLHGCGGGIIWVISIPYMDSNIRVQNISFYVGLFYIASTLGPACGYIFGGMFLTIYIDVGRVDMEDVTVELGDPQWLGAWWIGYLISVGLMICAAVMVFTFPRELPSGLRYKKDRKSQAHKGTGDDVNKVEDFGKSWRHVLYSLKIVLLNPIFIANTIAGIASGGIITAFGVFMPKLMEAQFALSAGAAALMSGIVLLPGACVGLFIGGCVPKVLKSQPRGLLGQCLFASISGIIFGFIYLIHCKTQAIAGVNVPYFAYDPSMTLDEPDVYHSCNAPCNCTTDSYDPICGEYDQVQYFNPCLAGCQVTWDDEYGTRYEECLCVNMTDAPTISPNYTGWYYPDAWRGFCEEDCSTELGIFLFLFLLQQILVFVGMPAGQAITMRTIPDKERAFAAGLNSALIRYLGNVPAPLIFGAIFDTSCILWQESCDKTGHCWIYDSNGLAWGMTWSVVVVSSICALCYGFGIIVYRPPPEMTDEKEVVATTTSEVVPSGGDYGETNGIAVAEKSTVSGDVNAGYHDDDSVEITRL